MAYVTTTDVKADIGVSGTANDATIAALIATVEKALEDTTGMQFVKETATRYVDYWRDDMIRLDYPLVTLTSITNGDGNAVDVNDVVLFPYNGPPYARIIAKAGAGITFQPSSDGVRDIAVTGDWGYVDSAGNTPDIVRTIVSYQVGYLFNRMDAVGAVTVFTGDNMVRYADRDGFWAPEIEGLVMSLVWNKFI